MKKIFSIVLLSSLVATGAYATQFAADPAHSGIDFTIRHLVSNVRGSFTDFSGNFNFDPKSDKLEGVNFKVKAASVNTSNVKRDEHLRSPDFFDVAKYPEISFVEKSAKKHGKNKFKLDGDLTMHGVTKPVSWDVEYLGTSPNMTGGTAMGFVATTKLNRKDFGINWNKALDQGGAVLGDEVTLTVNLEADADKMDAKKETKEETKKSVKKGS